MPAPKRSPTTFMPAINGPSITSKLDGNMWRASSVSPSTNSAMPLTSACVRRSPTGLVRHSSLSTTLAVHKKMREVTARRLRGSLVRRGRPPRRPRGATGWLWPLVAALWRGQEVGTFQSLLLAPPPGPALSLLSFSSSANLSKRSTWPPSSEWFSTTSSQ